MRELELYDAVARVATEWDELADRTGASPFVRPGWLDAWYAAFGHGRPVVAVLRSEGGLAAVAALERRGGTLASATNWHTPEYDIVAESDEAARELARAVVALRPRRLEFRFLNTDALTLHAFPEAARHRRYHLLARLLEESPYVPIDGDWDAYEATLGGSLVHDLGRRRRRLEQQGRLTFDVADGREGLEALLGEGFAVEHSGWKGRAGTSILSRPETRAFYTAIARWAAERGWLRLAFLRLDGHAIAFQLDLEVNRVVYHLKPGYDEQYARFSPGMLLMGDVIRRAFAAGATSYEFLGAAERHKLAWTRSVRERRLLQAFAPRPGGVVELAAFRFGRPLATRALETYRRARGRTR